MTSAPKQPPITPEDDANWQMLPSVGALLRMTFEKWYNDNIPRHAAALAFYTLFAIAPLLLLSVEAMALIYGRETAEKQLAAQIEQYVHNADAAALTQTILDNALPSSANWFVTVGIIIALIYGASAVFNELQVMLNIIWGVHPENGGDFRQVLRQRILALIMVLLSGLLIVVGLVVTLWYSEATAWVSTYVHNSSSVDQLAYFLITFGLTALVFALIYQFVPDVHIAWHDVLIGAGATAFLVSVARLLITLYLTYNRIGSVYGAAGSLVILLLWVYYSSQIFFLGAEFTHVYGLTYGARRRNEPIGTTGQFTLKPNRGATRRGEEAATAAPSAPSLVIKAEERQPTSVEIEIINLNEQDETIAHTRQIVEVEEQDAPAKKRPRFGLPQLFRPKRQLSPPTLPAFGGRFRTFRARLATMMRLPLTLFRPIRELFMAIGVIGALSLAALFGFPWYQRRTATPKPIPGESAPNGEEEAQ